MEIEILASLCCSSATFQDRKKALLSRVHIMLLISILEKMDRQAFVCTIGRLLSQSSHMYVLQIYF